MKPLFAIPEHLQFRGDVPGEAATNVLDQLQVREDAGLSEWQIKRLGKITASMFPSVKYLKNGNWGETALSYLYDLVGEHLTGETSETFTGSKATEWGNVYEREALDAYKKRTRRKVQPSQFYQHKTLPWVGGTPDGPVGLQGLIEAKCPLNYKNHIRTVITKKVPVDYIDQVLGQIWLSGRDWCDFVSYDPRIRGPHGLVIVRVQRIDFEPEIEELEERITAFHELLLATLKKLGVKPGVNIPKL